MKRKLIKQGGGKGLTLYIPKKWADQRNLKGGDEINVEESGDFLILAAKSKGEKQIEVSFTQDDSLFFRHAITRLYRLGYERIVIKSTVEKILKDVETSIINVLLGFEVVQKSKNTIIIENISEPSEDKFETILRRVFLIIKEMSVQPEAVASIEEQRNQIDKLIFFCKRVINKKVSAGNHPLMYWELLTYLSLIGHAYHGLSKFIQGKTLGSESQEYLKHVNEYYNLLYLAFYNKDRSLIAQMSQKKMHMVFNHPEKLLEQRKENPAIIAKIQYIARLVQLTSGSVFYLIID